MNKKAISLLLLSSMIFVLFSGCNKATSASESSSNPSAEATDASAEQASTDASSADHPNWLSNDTVTLTYWMQWPPFLQTVSQPGDNPLFKELEDRLNVTLDMIVVSTETVSETFNLMVASGDMADLIQSGADKYTGGGQRAVEDEVLYDLAPLIKEYAPNIQGYLDSDDDLRKTLTTDEGYIPQISSIYKDSFYGDQGFWIRSDWLSDLGLEVPTTVDEFDSTLEAFKTQKDASDPVVVLSEGNLTCLSSAYEIGTYDKPYILEDGKLVNTLTQDSYKQFLTKMNEFYNKSYFSHDFTSYTDSDTKPPEALVTGDETGCFNEDVSSITSYYLKKTGSSFGLTAMPSLVLNKGEKLDTGRIPSRQGKYNISLSTDCSNPEVAVKYLDYLFSDDALILCNYGIEGTTFNYDETGEPQYTDLIMNNEDFAFQLSYAIYINPGFPSIVDLNADKKTYTEEQLAASDIWNSQFGSTEKTVPAYTLTTEENDEASTLLTDIKTYVLEWRLKFITGETPISEFDSFVSGLKSMGADQIQEINQAAYERYMAK